MALDPKKTKRSWLSLLRDTRGAAYAEAVIVLPVLITILWGNYLVMGAGSSKLEAMNEVRRVAWEAANTPSRCEESSDHDGADRFDGGGVVTELMGWMGEAEDIPIIGDLLADFFGVPHIPSPATSSYDIPGAFGGGTGSASAEYMVMCNTERKTISMMLSRAFCDLVEKISGGSVPSFLSGMCSE